MLDTEWQRELKETHAIERDERHEAYGRFAAPEPIDWHEVRKVCLEKSAALSREKDRLGQLCKWLIALRDVGKEQGIADVVLANQPLVDKYVAMQQDVKRDHEEAVRRGWRATFETMEVDEINELLGRKSE